MSNNSQPSVMAASLSAAVHAGVSLARSPEASGTNTLAVTQWPRLSAVGVTIAVSGISRSSDAPRSRARDRRMPSTWACPRQDGVGLEMPAAVQDGSHDQLGAGTAAQTPSVDQLDDDFIFIGHMALLLRLAL